MQWLRPRTNLGDWYRFICGVPDRDDWFVLSPHVRALRISVCDVICGDWALVLHPSGNRSAAHE